MRQCLLLGGVILELGLTTKPINHSTCETMNPFISFLIVVPLALCIIVDAVAIYSAIFLGAPTVAIIFVLTPLSAVLVYLFMRARRNPFLDFKGAQNADPAARNFLTNFVLIVIYVALFGGLAFVLQVNNARYWIGSICTIFGIFMLASAVLQVIRLKRHVNKAARESNDAALYRLEQYQSVVVPEKKMRKWLIVSFLIAAVLAWPIFTSFNLGRFLSVFDLFGLLFLSGAVVLWVVISGMALDRNTNPFLTG
jgi:drug/metabolite transporter (DMT)-like permease